MSRRAHEPTPEQRKLVSALTSFGITQQDICTQIEINLKTLRKHYRAELTKSIVMANAKVAESLFKMATQKGNVAAAIFWAKTRMGWRETIEIDQLNRKPEVIKIVVAAKPDDD